MRYLTIAIVALCFANGFAALKVVESSGQKAQVDTVHQQRSVSNDTIHTSPVNEIRSFPERNVLAFGLGLSFAYVSVDAGFFYLRQHVGFGWSVNTIGNGFFASEDSLGEIVSLGITGSSPYLYSLATYAGPVFLHHHLMPYVGVGYAKTGRKYSWEYTDESYIQTVTKGESFDKATVRNMMAIGGGVLVYFPVWINDGIKHHAKGLMPGGEAGFTFATEYMYPAGLGFKFDFALRPNIHLASESGRGQQATPAPAAH